MLLDIGHADVNHLTEDGNTPLMVAAWDNQEEMIKLLLDHHAEVFGRVNNKGDDAVKMALKHGHPKLALYLSDVALKQQRKEERKEVLM